MTAAQLAGVRFVPADQLAPAPTRVFFTTTPSPIGELLITGVESNYHGSVITGLHMVDQVHAPPRDASWIADACVLTGAVEQLEAYFDRELTGFDLPLFVNGTQFQQAVWQTLTEIPYGSTISYGELATEVGSPGASRAVGSANGRNPIAIVIPCHRVIAAGGKLGGYGGGLHRKQQLLDLERQ